MPRQVCVRRREGFEVSSWLLRVLLFRVALAAVGLRRRLKEPCCVLHLRLGRDGREPLVLCYRRRLSKMLF